MKALILSLFLLFSLNSFSSGVECQKLPNDPDIYKECFEDLDDYDWPKSTIMGVFNVSPEEAMAVFVNFENHKNFSTEDQVTKSYFVYKNEATRKFEVGYKLSVLGDIGDSYSVMNTVKKLDNGYRSDWVKTNSVDSMTRKIKGSIFFKERTDGKTFVIYTNIIHPPKAFRWGFDEKAKEEARAFFRVLKRYTENNVTQPEIDYLRKLFQE